jgi:hypothetical protein
MYLDSLVLPDDVSFFSISEDAPYAKVTFALKSPNVVFSFIPIISSSSILYISEDISVEERKSRYHTLFP